MCKNQNTSGVAAVAVIVVGLVPEAVAKILESLFAASKLFTYRDVTMLVRTEVGPKVDAPHRTVRELAISAGLPDDYLKDFVNLPGKGGIQAMVMYPRGIDPNTYDPNAVVDVYHDSSQSQSQSTSVHHIIRGGGGLTSEGRLNIPREHLRKIGVATNDKVYVYPNGNGGMIVSSVDRSGTHTPIELTVNKDVQLRVQGMTLKDIFGSNGGDKYSFAVGSDQIVVSKV